MKAPVSVEAVRGYLDAANELGIRDGKDLAIVGGLVKQGASIGIGTDFSYKITNTILSKSC
jgi:hypothetical protein